MTILSKTYGKKIKNLGEGTYGNVGLYKRKGIEYAVKTIIVKNKSDEIAQDFLFEINCFKRCNHNNVVKMIDFFSDFSNKKRNMHYIIMELGINSLDKVLEEDEIKEVNIKPMIYEIICGLQHILNQSIITGDIKPGNIIIFNNKIGISDFGLAQINACIKKDKEWISDTVYTLNYRPPEILLGDNCTEKCESWALGCIIYEMVYNDVPFIFETVLSSDGMSSNKKLNLEEKEQIIKIFSKVNFNLEEWPEIINLPRWKDEYLNIKLSEIPFVYAEDPLLNDLISKLLILNPKKRLNIRDALDHPYFDDFKEQMTEEYKLNYPIENILSFEDKLLKYDIQILKRSSEVKVFLKKLIKKLKEIIEKNELAPRILVSSIQILDSTSAIRLYVIFRYCYIF